MSTTVDEAISSARQYQVQKASFLAALATFEKNHPLSKSKKHSEPPNQGLQQLSITASEQDFEKAEARLIKLAETSPTTREYFDIFQEGRRRAANMPGREEQATGHLTDQVAKDSKDSGASSHPIHDVSTGAKEGQDTSNAKATSGHHNANPGPVIAQNMPEAESRAALKKRSEELNK